MSDLVERLRDPFPEYDYRSEAADRIEQLERELASEEEMREECQKSLEGMGRKWAAEKALSDVLWVSFLEYRKRLRRAAYNVVVAADKAEEAYRKARGL